MGIAFFGDINLVRFGYYAASLRARSAAMSHMAWEGMVHISLKN